MRYFMLLYVVALMALAGCSSDPSGPGSTSANCPDPAHLDLKATLDLRDETGATAKDQYSLDVSNFQAGGKKDYKFQIGNTANLTTARALLVKSVQLQETDLEGKAVAAPVFTCLGPDGKPCAESTWPPIVPAGLDKSCGGAGNTQATSFTVRFTQPATAVKRRVKISLAVSGDPLYATATRDLVILTEQGVPSLKCSKTLHDFLQVPLGQDASATVSCSNVGTDTLYIDEAEVLTESGMPLTVTLGGQIAKPGLAYQGTPGVSIEKGETLLLFAQLAKLTATTKMSATLRLHSNDPALPVTDVQFRVNTTGPCLLIEPASNPMDFGASPVGVPVSKEVQLINCGTETLNLATIALEAGGDAGFALDFSGSCKAPAPAAPLTLDLDVNPKCSLFVTYNPPQVTADAKATLAIESNGGSKKIALHGSGTQASCPVACVKVKANDPKGVPITTYKQGDPVIPQTTLLLDGNCSTAPTGHVLKTFKYTMLKQPSGSYAVFSPAAQLTKPAAGPVAVAAIALNAAGTYKIRMDVTDDAGTPACAPVLLDVTVVPDDKLHIELTWDTPNDKDPTDVGDKDSGKKDGKFIGSDFDLHFAHPNAMTVTKPAKFTNGPLDPWFTPCWDCYLLNAKPPWGDSSTDDDPRLDLDDKDGWGPENTNIHVPEPGALYFVGVHDWNDNGFGSSTPRVRIYLDNQPVPVFDKIGPAMVTGDFWCAQRVAWNPNKLEPCAGADASGNLLVHKYKFDYTATNFACPK